MGNQTPPPPKENINNNNNNNATNDDNSSAGDDSPKQSSSQLIMITVRSMMEREDVCRVELKSDATVRDLRRAFRRIRPKAESQALLYEGKELKEDDKMLADYGMKGDCSVQLVPKMSSGTVDTSQPAEVILIGPDFMSDLREAIRNVHPALPSKAPVQNPTPQQLESKASTPEKQMEHALTRNRMKELAQRRKKLRQQSQKASATSSSDAQSTTDLDKESHSPTSGASHGSICGSVGRSPRGSQPGTPPELKLLRQQQATATAGTTVVEVKDPPASKKEVKKPSAEQATKPAEILHRNLYSPPQNYDELKKIKEYLQKTTCGVCKRRLPLIQRSLKCRCKRVFCQKHRDAELHKCSVDYKYVGRKKLEKEIPKIDMSPARQGKLED